MGGSQNKEVIPVQTQTVKFAVTRNKGNITRIGRTSIEQLQTNFKGAPLSFMRISPNRKASDSRHTGGWFYL